MRRVEIYNDLPSPLMGEGGGEGDSEIFRLPLILSHQGRGDSLELFSNKGNQEK